MLWMIEIVTGVMAIFGSYKFQRIAWRSKTLLGIMSAFAAAVLLVAAGIFLIRLPT